MEVRDRATYVRHHKKKIALLFSAMQPSYDEDVRGMVDSRLCDARGPCKHQQLHRRVGRAKNGMAQPIRVDEAGEWRMRMLDGWAAATLGVLVRSCCDDRFLCSKAEFAEWAARKAARHGTLPRDTQAHRADELRQTGRQPLELSTPTIEDRAASTSGVAVFEPTIARDVLPWSTASCTATSTSTVRLRGDPGAGAGRS
jgi:hypothetical protein